MFQGRLKCSCTLLSGILLDIVDYRIVICTDVGIPAAKVLKRHKKVLKFFVFRRGFWPRSAVPLRLIRPRCWHGHANGLVIPIYDSKPTAIKQ